MSFSSINTAIRSRMLSQWGTTTSIVMDGMPTPASGEFVRFQILHVAAQQIAMGATLPTRTSGFVFIRVNVPAGKQNTVSRAEALADQAKAAFQYYRIGGEDFYLTFQAASATTPEQIEGYYTLLVKIPFRVDAPG